MLGIEKVFKIMYRKTMQMYIIKQHSFILFLCIFFMTHSEIFLFQGMQGLPHKH